MAKNIIVLSKREFKLIIKALDFIPGQTVTENILENFCTDGFNAHALITTEQRYLKARERAESFKNEIQTIKNKLFAASKKEG